MGLMSGSYGAAPNLRSPFKYFFPDPSLHTWLQPAVFCPFLDDLGRPTGQKPPLKLKDILAIRMRLRLHNRVRIWQYLI